MVNRKNISFNQRQSYESNTLPYAKALLGKMGFNNISDTTGTNLDFNAATDFTATLDDKPLSIAYRCRNRSSFQYRDFGLRASTRNGSLSELNKIKEGLVDFYLYVYLREDNSFLYNYFLLDVNWANNVSLENRQSVFEEPLRTRKIKDATFADFSWEQLKPYIVVNSFLM